MPQQLTAQSNTAEAGPLGIAEAMLREALSSPTLSGRRASLDAMTLGFAVGDSVDVEPAALGGVEGLLVRALSAPADRVLLWLHGGGYVLGSPRGYVELAARLSEACHTGVFVPDYRLAPEHPFPAAVDDATAVVTAAVSSYGAANTVVGGDSAGGGLVLAVLLRLRERQAQQPAAAILVSPLADLTISGTSMITNADTDVAISVESVGAIVDAYLQGFDAGHPLASPALTDLSGLPPTLVLASTREALRDDAIRIDESLRTGGSRSTLLLYPDTCHAWILFASFLAAGAQAMAEIGEFVRAAYRGGNE
jgi:monoterpene epsilon-lactone hydrolase